MMTEEVIQARKEIHAQLVENSNALNRVNPSLDPETARSLLRRRAELLAAIGQTQQ